MNPIKRFAWWLVRREWSWRAMDATFLRVSRYLDWARSEVERIRRDSVDGGAESDQRGQSPTLFSRVFPTDAPTLPVLDGPFRGMLYPGRRAIGSELAPKLLGFYEWELQPLIERCAAQPYANVVDIGSAEGYYAVGLARRLPNATVYAFDIDPDAAGLCDAMAALNGVAARVVTKGACDAAALSSIAATGRTLIISDCEGFERELFSADVVAGLAVHDLIIECHDFILPGTSAELRRRFERTHLVLTVTTVPDGVKPDLLVSESLASFSRDERRRLLSEHRPAEMVWLYLTPRDAVSR